MGLSINLYRLRIQGADFALKLATKANIIESEMPTLDTEDIQKETTKAMNLDSKLPRGSRNSNS
jgi:hypothetical protein